MDKLEQKKSSCVTCRRRKKKCLGGNPCHRCKASNIECIYTLHAQKGRPPKNAIVNKLILERDVKGTNYMGTTMCKEFIFEQFSFGKVFSEGKDPAYSNTIKGDTTLAFFVNEIYLSFFGSDNEAANVIAKMRKSSPRKLTNPVRLHDIQTFSTWTLGQMVNILIRRFSRMKLENYAESTFMLGSLMMDDSSSFFGCTSENLNGEDGIMMNPLNSLPPQQAMRMIDCFFSIQPFCHLLNKTLLLQSYWDDSADSLLMTVVFGTTAYYLALLEGQPLFLWETATSKDKRNPFLDYAYYLLENANPSVTLSRYQAVVILALFEVQYGYSKKGMSLFALTIVLNRQLGVFDPEVRAKMSEVEQEMLIMAFWASNNCIIRGCMELDQVIDELQGRSDFPFPPITAASSVSFLHDARHRSNRAFVGSYDYLIESFYAESVIAYFAARLFHFFPETGFNLFNVRWPQIVVQTSQAAAEIEEGIQAVLQAFTKFVKDNRHLWTNYQQYAIGATLLLYKIHFSFVRDYIMTSRMITEREGMCKLPSSMWTNGGGHWQDEGLGMGDIDVILKMDQIAPVASKLVAATLEMLTDPKQYDTQWLPEAIIVSCLETSARIAMLKFKRDRDLQSWQDLEIIHCLTGSTVWRTQYMSVKKVEAMVADFFLSDPVHPNPPAFFPNAEQQEYASVTTAAVDAAIPSLDASLALVQLLPPKSCSFEPEGPVSSLSSELVLDFEAVSYPASSSSSSNNSIQNRLTPPIDSLFTAEEWLDH